MSSMPAENTVIPHMYPPHVSPCRYPPGILGGPGYLEGVLNQLGFHKALLGELGLVSGLGLGFVLGFEPALRSATPA